LPEPDRTAAAERCASRAMQLLTAAKAAGHFANADALRQLGADPVLAPLYGRADFKSLLNSDEGGAKKSPR
jgi:hypothetical protein